MMDKTEISKIQSDCNLETNRNSFQSTSNLKDADFWYHKGFTLGKKDKMQTAIDCYKEALVINQQHYPSMFNLACCYQKSGRNELALEYF